MKKILIGLIRFYQKLPFSSHKVCRYTPTCSDYAIKAIEEHGAWKGMVLTFKRIFRCRPGGGHGFDPVPKKEKHYEKH